MFFVIRGHKVWKAVRGVHRDIVVSVFLIYSVKMTGGLYHGTGSKISKRCRNVLFSNSRR